MTPAEQARLRALAMAATPGPWSAYAYRVRKIDPSGEAHVMCDYCWSPVEAAYIAAANPAAILELLDLIEQFQKRGGTNAGTV